jgi:hypothetical protein
MTQHAIQMVQRNLTPGGAKTARILTLRSTRWRWFTRNHINALRHRGRRDSDFIALVEKAETV